MQPHIRRLDHSEATLLRELRVAALEDSPREFGETLAEARDRSEQSWSDLAPSAYVAELDGRLVGMAFAFQDQTDPDTARVGGMWVAPSLRRAGVGLALLRAALSWARAQSKRRVRLWAIPGAAAEALYRRACFVPTGLERPFPGDASPRVLMEMQLNLETVEEIPLPSGRMTKGVVRVGNTVRRPTKESSAFVARLLAHLETSACVWAPRYLGRDEASRDILSYIPGATPEKWGYFSDVQ
ncbi:MAG TPA: GNAT family N-acetyltransferase, partial [Polyangiaceae bacterium]|nr:GNAT family N-acetyltransferase [Polyangiaceae bacterium]